MNSTSAINDSQQTLQPVATTAGAVCKAIYWRKIRRVAFLSILFVLCLVALSVGLSAGAVPVPVRDVWFVVSGQDLASVDPVHAQVVQSLRIPRGIACMVVGASMAVAGCSLQGLMRNPLADPGLVGVAAGAALGAVITIVFAADFIATLPPLMARSALPVCAFLGGLITTFCTYKLAHQGNYTDVALLLLVGIAINAIVASVIGFSVFVSDDQQLRDFQFWSLGSFAGVSWNNLLLPTLMMIMATLGLWRFAGVLNGLALGESDARFLGFDVERLKSWLIVLVALAVGAGVALAGAIGFVGLVVPHLVRLVVGIDHHFLLPGSALLGGSFLLLADTIARLIVLPAELPIGIITSAVGGPFFLILLMVRRRSLAF